MQDPALDSHYAAVVPILAEGRVVPFLGAGVNRAGRAPGAVWREGGNHPPDGAELARWLAKRIGYQGHDEELLRVAQYYDTTLGEGELYHCVRKVLKPKPQPTGVHEFLAQLPRRLRSAMKAHPDLQIEHPHPLIVTTNYDDALEIALENADEPYDVVTYIAKGKHAGRFEHLRHGEDEPRVIMVPNEYTDVSPTTRTVLLKLHGAIDRDRERGQRDSYVITEDNYIDYLAVTEAAGTLPVSLAAKLQLSHILFLGYGLKDWNLRVILRRLWGARELKYTSWAIQLSPDPVEQKFWRKRDVEIHDAELQGYVTALDRHLTGYLREGPPIERQRAAAR